MMSIVATVLDWVFGTKAKPCVCQELRDQAEQMENINHPLVERMSLRFNPPDYTEDLVPRWLCKPEQDREAWLATEFFSRAWLAWLRQDWWGFYMAISDAEECLGVLIAEDAEEEGAAEL